MEIKRLSGLVRKAVDDYELIDEGDHIAVGVSGGKDSLTLLVALSNLKRYYPKHFDIHAITVDLGFGNQDFGSISDFCAKLDIPFDIIPTDIAKIVFDVRGESNPCSLCAKMRKGSLNKYAKEIGCNKVAYAHHRDDVIETMMLSLLYEGQFYAFPPKTFLDRTKLWVIRPMIYVTEADIIGFKNKYELPVCKNPCPADGNTKRQYVKDLVNSINRDNPGVRKNMFHAIQYGNIIDWPPAPEKNKLSEN